MTNLLLLIGASARAQLRWAKEHVYSWLILGPLILGMTYVTASRFSDNVALWRPSPLLAILLLTMSVICLVGLSLSRASAELYHVRLPESYFDALPIPIRTHLHAALVKRFARTSIVGVIILVARSLFIRDAAVDLFTILSIILFAAVVAMAEVFAALNWIHWNHRREMRAAMLAVFALLIAAAWSALLLLLAINPDEFAYDSLTAGLIASGILMLVVLYPIIQSQHERWRASDIEFARRLETTGRLSISATRPFGRRLAPAVAAQLARDLQLTLRAFSSAVYVVIGVAALLIVMLFVALKTGFALSEYLLPPGADTSGWFNSTWLPSVMTVKLICTALTTTLVALLPVLVAYELPLLWLERAAGTTGLQIWQAKLLYARLVSAPAPVVAWLVAMATGETPLNYSPALLAECLWLWWIVSSIMGSLSFEMPERSGLSIILMVTIGMAAGVLTSMLWPMGLLIYLQSMHALTDRGRIRARYYLITEDD